MSATTLELFNVAVDPVGRQVDPGAGVDEGGGEGSVDEPLDEDGDGSCEGY